jgi:hypothetical protein
MNRVPDSMSPPERWGESLLRAKAQIAAGKVVAMAPVIDRLLASAERMEARRPKAARKA